MKYLMAPICTKYDDDNNLHVRRALVSFKKIKSDGFGGKIYLETRLVGLDDYFKNENSSHTYQFYDDGFALVDCKYPETKAMYEKEGILGKVRPYHTLHMERYCWVGEGKLAKATCPIVFRAKTDLEALKRFKEREELR